MFFAVKFSRNDGRNKGNINTCLWLEGNFTDVSESILIIKTAGKLAFLSCISKACESKIVEMRQLFTAAADLVFKRIKLDVNCLRTTDDQRKTGR